MSDDQGDEPWPDPVTGQTWDCFMGDHHWCVGVVIGDDMHGRPCRCECHPTLW